VHPHSTSNLLDLKDCIVNKITHSDTAVRITISTKPKLVRCPACGLDTSKVHDYRHQTIKDLPLMTKNTLLILS
jgi:transposase